MSLIANTPKPPYYAVIFSSHLAEDDSGYTEMAKQMVEKATIAPGFLGVESARADIGITVSYWKDLDSIREWKANIDHLEAQKQGKERWYAAYKVRISRVERDYELK